MRYWRKDRYYSVYALWLDDEIVYFGMTNNLDRRLEQHRERCDFAESGNGDQFFWKGVSAVEVADSGDVFTARCVERWFLVRLAPKHNSQVGKSSKYSNEVCDDVVQRIIEGGRWSNAERFVDFLNRVAECSNPDVGSHDLHVVSKES
jgi:hypothetical protein